MGLCSRPESTVHAKFTIVDHIIGEIILNVVISKNDRIHNLQKLVISLRLHEQRKFLESTLSFLTSRYLPPEAKKAIPTQTSPRIAGSAAILSHLISSNGGLKENLVVWLASNFGSTISSSIATKRAAFAALARDEGSPLSRFWHDHLLISLQKLFRESWKRLWSSSAISYTSSTLP